MGKISVKEYYCPLCKNVSRHSTNHYGEIYTPCRICGNSVLYCKEANTGEPHAWGKLMFYRFNVSNPSELEMYNNMKLLLKAKGYKKFSVNMKHIQYEELLKYNGVPIGLYNINQFEDQVVSTIGRIHYWTEMLWDNKSIKSGFYLVD